MADTPRKNWLGRALDAVAETEINPLALAWRMLPPEARKAYASLPAAIGELSPGAAIRDTVQASGETANAAMQGRGWDAAGGVANMLTAAAGILPGGRLLTKGAKAANPIRAYHGSPHDFDRFDMSKIGTGEGAQAYGHGLYFAENPAVAEAYKGASASAGRAIATLDGVPLSEIKNKTGAIDWLDSYGSINNTRTALAGRYPDALKELDELVKSGRLKEGSMYEVNIHADPAKFLDWDKPLSAQSAPVQKALEQFGIRAQPEQMRAYDDALLEALTTNKNVTLPNQPRDPLGNDIYHGGPRTGGLGGYSNPIAASNALRDAGIPGIKYLDGGSRSAGTGSSNYVAFDDKLIEILRKYGLLPVAAGGAAAAANPLSVSEGEAY